LIGIIIALFLLFCFTSYTGINKSKSITALEQSIAKRDFEINQLKVDMFNQSKISDSLKASSMKQDSLIKLKDIQIANIKSKYDAIKGKVKELNLEESVKYLKYRLYQLDSNIQSNYPSLVLYNNMPLVLIDTIQTRLLNITFVKSDECNEELDSTKSLVELLTKQINTLTSLTNSQAVEIVKCVEIVGKQDLTIKDKSSIITEKDATITKLDKKIKTKNVFIRILGGVAAVLGIIALLK
jgi:hypothetical protein